MRSIGYYRELLDFSSDVHAQYMNMSGSVMSISAGKRTTHEQQSGTEISPHRMSYDGFPKDLGFMPPRLSRRMSAIFAASVTGGPLGSGIGTRVEHGHTDHQ
jgi:hypothetical protein